MRIRHQVTLEAYLQEVAAENLLLKLPSRPVVRVKAAALFTTIYFCFDLRIALFAQTVISVRLLRCPLQSGWHAD